MRRRLSLLIALSIFLMSTTSVLAEEKLWFKGAAYTSYLKGEYVGKTVGGLSTSAHYTFDGSWGYNRVRVWSRTFAVKEYYDSIYTHQIGSSVWVSNVYITNLTSSTAAQSFTYDTYQPQPTSSTETKSIVGAMIYDIMGLLQIPTNLIGTIEAAHTNKISTKVLVNNSGRSITTEFRNPDYARDLPLGAATWEPDSHETVFGKLSSYSAGYWYKLSNLNKQFPFEARAKLNYTYRYYDMNADDYVYITAPTNEMYRTFTVNN